MGYSGRGNGFTFDSLNGYCCLVGVQTGKVIAFKTFNRMCKMCKVIQKTGVWVDHDCRCNYSGSAKGMEAEGARQIVTESQSLKNANIQIGGFVADNDSSSKLAVESSVDYKVLNQSDIAHTKKGLKNMLWDISKSQKRDPDKELNKDVIDQFVRCFSAAVHQNKGNLVNMKLAIANISQHAKGCHENCGSWCGVQSGKENYQSSFSNLKNKTLRSEIDNIFSKFSENAEKFITAGSSQANESLNNTMAQKAPKRICYSQSASADYRFAAAVNQKNYNEHYIVKTMDKVGLSHTGRLDKHIERMVVTSQKRASTASEPQHKRHRLELQTARSQLRYRHEKTDEFTYQSNVTLLDHVAPVDCLTTIQSPDCVQYGTGDIAIVFYDIETGGFDLNHDILQICMSTANYVFNTYLTPTQPIHPKASEVHKLTKVGKFLFKNGSKKLFTLTNDNAIIKIIEFLQKLEKKCLMVAHNHLFDAPRLVKLIENSNHVEDFKKLIYGFTDSLELLRKSISGQDSYKLENLAKNILQISSENAHDAAYDVDVLKKLVTLYVLVEEIVENYKSYDFMLTYFKNLMNVKKIILGLSPLEGTISSGMIKRLAKHDITFSKIIDLFFSEKGEEKVIEFVSGKKNGKAEIIKKKNIIEDIINFLKELKNFCEK